MVAGRALSSQAAPVATAGDVVEQDPSGDEQYFDHLQVTYHTYTQGVRGPLLSPRGLRRFFYCTLHFHVRAQIG